MGAKPILVVGKTGSGSVLNGSARATGSKPDQQASRDEGDTWRFPDNPSFRNRSWNAPAHRLASYCLSVTCSSHSTTLPSSASWMAMCVMLVVAVAPCQCFTPGGNQTTSPGRTSSTSPPSRCTQPQPAVMIRVWPSGCVCHAVRAPGSNVTLAPAARAGALALNRGSMRTAPVNHSAGPLLDGCVPTRLTSTMNSCLLLEGATARLQPITGWASAVPPDE